MKIQAFYRRIVDDPPYLSFQPHVLLEIRSSFASGEIGFMAYGAMGIGPLENPPQTDPSFASGEIGFMAYGAMGIRTPDLLNAIEALYQLSYDPLPKPKQIAESAQCHNPIAKEIVLLAIPSSPSFPHD